jgi:hypothetical protein
VAFVGQPRAGRSFSLRREAPSSARRERARRGFSQEDGDVARLGHKRSRTRPDPSPASWLDHMPTVELARVRHGRFDEARDCFLFYWDTSRLTGFDQYCRKGISGNLEATLAHSGANARKNPCDSIRSFQIPIPLSFAETFSTVSTRTSLPPFVRFRAGAVGRHRQSPQPLTGFPVSRLLDNLSASSQGSASQLRASRAPRRRKS